MTFRPESVNLILNRGGGGEKEMYTMVIGVAKFHGARPRELGDHVAK